MPDGSLASATGARRLLTGWGRTAGSAATVCAPRTADEVAAQLARAEPASVIPRGLGRSYGDAAQCAGGTVVELGAFDEIGTVGPATGLVEVGGGVSLHELMRCALPAGWFVPVSPGTRQVTVGGAIAADIHGKNHHREGSFCNHVTSVTLATPTGVREVTPQADPQLFWATAGGMGLTGVITRATVRLIAVETSWMTVDEERFDDLDGVMSAMVASDDAYRYSVAWVDCTTRGRHLGRGVLTRGEHTTRAELPASKRARPLVAPGEPRLRIPLQAPNGLLNPLSVAAYNELWFRKSPRRRLGALHSLSSFLHPLDGIADWNLLYGRRGFVQYQFAVGPGHGDTVREAIERLSTARIPSFLAVLKRFGPGNEGMLSFPTEGWTLALDVAVRPGPLHTVLDDLDELVAEAAGRVYLAKDARLRPSLFPTMYPRVHELAAVRSRIDPRGVLASDLSRRLGIDPAHHGAAADRLGGSATSNPDGEAGEAAGNGGPASAGVAGRRENGSTAARPASKGTT